MGGWQSGGGEWMAGQTNEGVQIGGKGGQWAWAPLRVRTQAEGFKSSSCHEWTSGPEALRE